ncbi:MAG: class I SAM-dependent methyltransferase [Deltaproteobacteria bacterium]|nr:class I SAM-dependent methyltransferase [Deltaproteobacteria bacterium]
MPTYFYEKEDNHHTITIDTFYGVFNNYRLWKYFIAMLLTLGKTNISEYRILEAGIGGNIKLNYLVEIGAKAANCFGFDINKRAIDVAASVSPENMNFQVASVMETPFKNNTFDLVICSGLFCCFKDTSDIKNVSQELRRIMKHNGVLMISDITERFPNYSNERHARHFKFFDTTKDEMEFLLSDEFSIFRRVNTFLSERYHIIEDTGKRDADIAELPLIDKGMDAGTIPCAYCLYSFLPKT